MSKLHPQDETTREFVKLFCDYVFRLKQIHFMYRELFADDDIWPLLEKIAHVFFLDLSNILADYFLLEVAKLTDPATSVGVMRENFTVANLIETVDWPPSCLQEINELNNTILSFRKHIKSARNRLLAHYDKATIVSSVALGGFPEGEEEKLLNVLEQMCNVLHRASFGDIFGDMLPDHLGDVNDLKEALKRAIAFDKLMSNSKGEDLARLSSLIKDVGTTQ